MSYGAFHFQMIPTNLSTSASQSTDSTASQVHAETYPRPPKSPLSSQGTSVFIHNFTLSNHRNPLMDKAISDPANLVFPILVPHPIPCIIVTT